MRRVLAFLALATFSVGSAQAASVDFGTIAVNTSAGSSLFFSAQDVAINDQWTFTLADEAGCCTVALVFDSAELDPFFGIDDFMVSSSSPDIVFNYDANDVAYTFAGMLAAGTYTIDVSGVTSGILGGEYEVLVGATVAAVPVPAAIWLFAGALGMLRFGARRR